MKKTLVVLMAVALCLGIWLSSQAFAQGMMGDRPMMKKGMMMGQEGMKGARKMMGPCPMMKKMMEKSMIATSDGGVVILVGNKLMKYDKNLNLVKEVEIKIDMEEMQNNMKEMMKNCPMMKGGMMGMAGDEPGQGDEPEEAEPKQ